MCIVLCRYVFGSGEERNMRAMMGSALGGADFEWAKTGDLRTEYMEVRGSLMWRCSCVLCNAMSRCIRFGLRKSLQPSKE